MNEQASGSENQGRGRPQGGRPGDRRRDYRGRPPKPQTPRKRRLNLRKIIEFKYEMDHILEDVPDSVKGTMKGSIIAKADKMDQAAAQEFIDSKVKDKTITEQTGKRLGNLLRDFCVYR